VSFPTPDCTCVYHSWKTARQLLQRRSTRKVPSVDRSDNRYRKLISPAISSFPTVRVGMPTWQHYGIRTLPRELCLLANSQNLCQCLFNTMSIIFRTVIAASRNVSACRFLPCYIAGGCHRSRWGSRAVEDVANGWNDSNRARQL
jgi:hypothetical protein